MGGRLAQGQGRMSWAAVMEWLAMGKHGAHVWGAYAFCFAVLAAMAAHAVGRKGRTLRRLRGKAQ